MPESALQYRIVVWVLRLGLPLLVVLGGVVYAAHRGAVRLMEPLRWYGEVTIEELSFDLGGKVHAKSISYRPFGVSENAALTLREVNITTPGLGWLVTAGLGRPPPRSARQRAVAPHTTERTAVPAQPHTVCA